MTYALATQPGYSNLRVALNGKAIDPAGGFYIGDGTVLVAIAERDVSVGPEGARVQATLEDFLHSTDRRGAFERVLEEVGNLTENATASESVLDAVISAIQADPGRAALLQVAMEEVAGMVLAPGLVLSPAAPNGGPFASGGGRPTLVLHVNGVLTELDEALLNYGELKKVVKETTLSNTFAAFSWNPSASALSTGQVLLKCTGRALWKQVGSWVVPGIASLAWEVARTCAATPREIPDLIEAGRQLVNLPIPSQYPQRLASELHSHIQSGVQVIVVPHSQGNMMLRDALARTEVTSADQQMLTSISLAPQAVPSTGRLARFDCWMVKGDLFEVFGVNACSSADSPLQTSRASELQYFQAEALKELSSLRCFIVPLPCAAIGATVAGLSLLHYIDMHNFVGSYLQEYSESRALLKHKLQEHKNFLDNVTVPPPPPPAGCANATAVFCDDFSAGLGNWTNPTGQGSWTIVSGQLVGDYDITCGSIICPQADLLLNANLMPASGNWRMEVQTILGQKYCCYNGGAIGNDGTFSVYAGPNEKEAFYVGKHWVGTPVPASSTTVDWSHQYYYPWAYLSPGGGVQTVPAWDPAQPQVISLEKIGNNYTMRWNGTVLKTLNRTFTVPPRIGLHTYGRVTVDNFKLYALP